MVGHTSDQRARESLQQHFQYALNDQQRRLEKDAGQLALLARHLNRSAFVELLSEHLGHKCLLFDPANSMAEIFCGEEQILPAALYEQLLQQSVEQGLVRAEQRLYFFQLMEAAGEQLVLLEPLSRQLLENWQESHQLPAINLSFRGITVSGHDLFVLEGTEGQPLGYLRYPLPRPGQQLVSSSLFPAMLILLLILNLGFFATYQLSKLVRGRERSERRLRQVIDLAPQMIYARDREGRFVLTNKAAADFFNTKPQHMQGSNLAELTGDNQAFEQQLRQERALLSSGESIYMKEELIPGMGQEAPRIWETSKLQFTDLDGKPVILSISQDVSTQREQQQQLQLLSSALEHSGSAILVCDAQGLIRYSNTRLCQLLGRQQQELINMDLDVLLKGSVSRHQRHQLIKGIRETDQWRGELQFKISAQRHYWMMVSLSPLELKNQSEVFYVLVAEDITALKQTHQKMEQLALYDTLTGLENRRLFKQRLHKAIKLSKRQTTVTALLYLDLDHFKRINDTLGHDSGDQLLITVAERLRTCVRESDSIARLGGDEFTLLVHDLQNPDAAAAVARKVIQQLSQPLHLGNKSVIVTTSVGIALAPTDSTSPTELMKNADLAMYRAKSQGRNTYQFFSQEMNAQATRLLEVETELRTALVEKSFEVYYQPQVNLPIAKVVGFEALVRWKHPERGMISPAEFIPIAEETGLIVELGRQVLEQACQDLVWLNQRLDYRCYVAVNLSPRQLKDPDLPAYLDNLLSRYDLPPQYLELEITESTLMDQMDLSLPILHAIEQLGISLSIDDFGTGYSSLSYLKQLPVHSLKIDRSFVRDIPGDRDDMAIISAVSAMAAKLNLEVVAEGVEEREQLMFLKETGCHLVQGYYFSPPLPRDKVLATCERIREKLKF
ncbi:putative bifunctional diguanylate cyclase/phosphodiesterase [Marinospirillum celere]|uniref:putative bifunctional diguanylate cyclase/phosphodiesterase n=1 Tax=Marinospirillum celere TaxID=1122252 RepID=UPI0015A68733|nr:EAL domain-containing protein [Marinospirillum celere]